MFLCTKDIENEAIKYLRLVVLRLLRVSVSSVTEVLCSRNSAKILFVLPLKPKLRFRSLHRSKTEERRRITRNHLVVEIIRGPAST